jgi:hypothetical protein
MATLEASTQHLIELADQFSLNIARFANTDDMHMQRLSLKDDST